jgi:16S rRNA (adenine1518-N6/adenine1519-N6)-dimethyltransferase
MEGLYHKKSLGQNFLTNKEKIGNIVAALELKSGDTVVEIGPGHGEITKELLAGNRGLKIIAIEKDEALAEELRGAMVARGHSIEIIAGDALKVLPSLKLESYKLVGNIPYYITGFLLRTVGGLERKPAVAVLTIQKEVAERIAAEPPKMNLLAASVRFWAEPKIVGFIPKEDFLPEPKVDSAIIRLVIHNPQPATRNNENYYKFIRILFKQPRKTILNNLLETGKNREEIEKILEENGIDPGDRAQNLNISQIKEMADAMAG